MAKRPQKPSTDMPKFRLLPLVMLIAVILLVVKTRDVIDDSQRLAKAFFAPDVIAQEKEDKPEEKPKEDAAKEEKKDEAKTEPAKEAAKPADTKPSMTVEKTKPGETQDSAAAEPAKDGEKKDGEKKEGDAAKSDEKKDEKDTADKDAADKDKDDKKGPPKTFSPIEVDILQSLAKRREELDEWAKKNEVRDNLLKATEQRIDGKVQDMNKLKAEIEALLAKYNTQEDTKLRSLVKIYENMKPKDAAAIFNEMEMPILLQLVDKMSERKAAPILAFMNPTRAKELTTELAEQRKLDQPTVQKATDATNANPAAGQ